jgi:ribosomal protein L23
MEVEALAINTVVEKPKKKRHVNRDQNYNNSSASNAYYMGTDENNIN